ncbi:MAG TPA: sulfatase [Planctomycetes bacterium]|nr:sulfatase [Planctomycetota bacterium]
MHLLHRVVLAPLAVPFLSAFAAPGPPVQTGGTPPNVLLIVADDMGVDMLQSYGEGTDFPVTPTLDSLAAGGMLFRNAWSNPNCSPTRATIMTGRYGLRTGIGDVIKETTPALEPTETTIPELLTMAGTGYESGAFGKWHLGNATNGGLLSPNVAGFHHYDGALGGALQSPPSWMSYYMWPETVNGSLAVRTDYATSVTVDSALAWIGNRAGPWFSYVAFNAPHRPFHAPPAGLYSENLTGLDPAVNERAFYKAMIEAMDTEMGRLLKGIGPELENTVVIFVGDNGSPRSTTVAPFLPSHGKATVYEGGINVPLIASGPGIQAGSECGGLVNTTDLFSTVAELAGVDVASWLANTKLDSVSLVPYFADPQLPSLRSWVYAERFRPVGATGYVRRAMRAIRDDRYKLILSFDRHQFFDLQSDPFELSNLLIGGLTPAEQDRYDQLKQTMLQLVTNP